jgi:hypothetical protein
MTPDDPTEAWLTAEGEFRAIGTDAYWRTIAYNDGIDLSPEIPVDGPHVDLETGELVPNPTTGEEVTPT